MRFYIINAESILYLIIALKILKITCIRVLKMHRVPTQGLDLGLTHF